MCINPQHTIFLQSRKSVETTLETQLVAQPFQGPTVPPKRHLFGNQHEEHRPIAWEMFLSLASSSYSLNKFPQNKPSFQ